MKVKKYIGDTGPNPLFLKNALNIAHLPLHLPASVLLHAFIPLILLPGLRNALLSCLWVFTSSRVLP